MPLAGVIIFRYDIELSNQLECIFPVERMATLVLVAFAIQMNTALTFVYKINLLDGIFIT